MQTANELRTALLLAVAVLIAAAASAQVAQSARESPPLPAAGVQQFERSAFCRKYVCSLDAIEPMRFGGEIREWFYNYRVFPPDPGDDTHEYTMQVGMRLARNGTRTSPYLIIRWYPISSAPEQEMQVAGELIKEAIGKPDFAAGAFLLKYARSLDFERRSAERQTEHGPWAIVGTYTIQLDFSRGPDKCRDPQLTVMIESGHPERGPHHEHGTGRRVPRGGQRYQCDDSADRH